MSISKENKPILLTLILLAAAFVVFFANQIFPSNSIFPSRSGDLTISISTQGRSPALARQIKKEISKTYDKGFAELLRLLSYYRKKVINNIPDYGNCIAASMPIALATAHAEGKLKRGDLILMGGTGAGLSVSFALIRW